MHGLPVTLSDVDVDVCVDDGGIKVEDHFQGIPTLFWLNWILDFSICVLSSDSILCFIFLSMPTIMWRLALGGY